MTVINEHPAIQLLPEVNKIIWLPLFSNLVPIANLFPSSGTKTVKLDSESAATLDYLN